MGSRAPVWAAILVCVGTVACGGMALKDGNPDVPAMPPGTGGATSAGGWIGTGGATGTGGLTALGTGGFFSGPEVGADVPLDSGGIDVSSRDAVASLDVALDADIDVSLSSGVDGAAIEAPPIDADWRSHGITDLQTKGTGACANITVESLIWRDCQGCAVDGGQDLSNDAGNYYLTGRGFISFSAYSFGDGFRVVLVTNNVGPGSHNGGSFEYFETDAACNLVSVGIFTHLGATGYCCGMPLWGDPLPPGVRCNFSVTNCPPKLDASSN
jgi:hypothetical protein